MNASRMKNIIVLKDLPSNLIDEAIVILKNGGKIKEKEIILENKPEGNFDNIQSGNTDIAIKEAEFLVTDYIKKLEKPSEPMPTIRKMRLQYKKLQIFSLFLGLTTIVRNYNINF